MDVTYFEKNLELIDISLEDDFLIASPLRHSLDDFRFSVALENVVDEDVIDFFGDMHFTEERNKSVYSPSIDTGIRRNNSRKSLAWDSAFFTSPGVLDPYELSIINKGFKEVEDRVSSDDLDASFDSDGFSVGSSECELFEDVRASIHRSFNPSSWKSGHKEAIKHNAQSLKKVDAVHQQHGILSKPTNRRGTVYLDGSKSTERSKPPQNTKTALVTHKPPKVVKGWNSSPVSAARTKRSSSKQLVNLPSKIAKRVVPGTPRTQILAKRVSHKLTSRYDLGNSASLSASISSESSLKSRGKVDSRNAKSLSVTKLPCKTPPQNKLMNHNYYSPCGSAVSCSIDGFSSVRSSSSSSSTNRLSKCPNIVRDTTPSVFSYDLHSSQWVLSPSRLTQESKTSPSTDLKRNGKPSGLRMPSPTIGYFDEKNANKQFCFEAQSQSPLVVVSQPQKTTLHKNSCTEISRRLVKKSVSVPSKSRNLNNNVSIERKWSSAKPGNLPKPTKKKILQLGEKENRDVNSLSSQFRGIDIC